MKKGKMDESKSDEESEIIEYLDCDFITGTDPMNYSKNLTQRSEIENPDNMEELVAENKFLGMSHFDEASKAGFGMEHLIGIHKNKLISQDKNSNLSKFDKNKINTRANEENPFERQISDTLPIDICITSGYNTNLSNVERNFNFNQESEMEFELDKTKQYRANADIKEIKEDPFEQETYLESMIFNKEKGTRMYETKSAMNLVNDKKKEMNLNIKKPVPFSKSIEEYDHVNFNSISNENVIKKITNNKTEKLLDKYKINIQSENQSGEIELQADTKKFFHQSLKEINSENFRDFEEEDKWELDYLDKLKELQIANEELKEKLKEKPKDNHLHLVLKEENEKLKNELEEMNSKLERKNREALDHKSKADSLIFDNQVMEDKINDLKSKFNQSKIDLQDKETVINSLKLELKKKEDHSNDDENINYKSQIESIKAEFNLHRQEMSKKAEKITELQQKLFQLEQDNMELRSKCNSETLSLREQKQLYENLKLNFMELKNEMELSNLKFQRVSDDNFNLKREIQILEKEVKSKNDLIDKYKNEIMEIRNSRNNSVNFDRLNYDLEDKRSNSNSSLVINSNNNHTYFQSTNDSFGNIQKSPSYHNSYNNSNKNNGNSTKSSVVLKNANNSGIYNQSENKIFNTQNKKEINYNLNSTSSNDSQYNIERVGSHSHDTFIDKSKNTIKENIQNKSQYYQNMNNSNNANSHHESKINILPSQKEIVQKESKILQIETKLFNLQQEREKVNIDKIIVIYFKYLISSSLIRIDLLL